MQIKKNINKIEYASIGLSIIGTVAAVATQQIAYIAAPLTLSLSLSLIDRQKQLTSANHRFENLEQQLSRDMQSMLEQSKLVNDSLIALPSAPTTIDFKKLQKSIVEDRRHIEHLSTVLSDLKQKDNDLTPFLIDRDVQNLIIAALNRGVSIDIGWGHLSDIKNNIVPLSKEILLNSKAQKWGGYSAVNWVYDLQTEYPNLLTLKILGTHEKFLVCDRAFAMLGSHNYMTSHTSSSEREVGIKTDNPEVIDKLVELFDR